MEEEEPKTTYANHMGLRVSNWDFCLTFGKITDITDDELFVKPDVRIYVSPQQAKSMARVLSKNVRDYERNIGVITGTPDLEEDEEDASG